jgi:hypothetical protein
MYAATDGMPELSRAARSQNGVIRRDQCLVIGLHRSYIRNQLDAQRWTAWGDKVLLLQNAQPSRRQLMWIAVLDASPIAALCSHTSLELAGFKSFAAEAKQIHLLVSRGAKVTRFPGVVVHESRRLGEEPWTRGGGLARTEVPRSVIDAAAWQPWPHLRASCLQLPSSRECVRRPSLSKLWATSGAFVTRPTSVSPWPTSLAALILSVNSMSPPFVEGMVWYLLIANPAAGISKEGGVFWTASGTYPQARSSC